MTLKMFKYFLYLDCLGNTLMRVATYHVEVLGKEKILTLGIGLINKQVTVYQVIEISLILEIQRKLY